MKQLLNRILGKMGYRIQDLRRFGREPWRDVQTLLRSTAAPLCFDVGAHRGETIQFIFQYFPGATVHAFEPDPESFEALQKIAQNFPRVNLHSMAMGDHLHHSKLLKTRFSQCNSLLSASSELQSVAHQKIGEVEIDVTTVDQFCKEHEISAIDFLKTDCQGLDLRVLKGASTLLSERRIHLIQCESMFGPEYEGQGWFYEILEFLTGKNYVPVSFGEPVRNENHEIMFSDVIFKCRELA